MPRWFEAVMNTPSHHRVHHATNPRYLDKNYRSEEHTSELQSLMRISYAVFCLKKKNALISKKPRRQPQSTLHYNDHKITTPELSHNIPTQHQTQSNNTT